MGRPGWIEARVGAGAVWGTGAYTYDSVGNVVSMGSDKYRYDLRSRLAGASLSGVSGNPYEGYTYDALGNLVRFSRGTLDAEQNPQIASTQEYAAGSSNRLDSSTTAQYSARGNLLSFQGTSLSWDRLDQVKRITTGNEQWQHVYDAAGERVWSWRTWSLTAGAPRIDRYTLRGEDSKVLREYTKTGSSWAWEDNVYREGQLLASAKSDGGVRHYALDHLGSVRYVTDAAGAPVSEHKYWPYGEEITSQANGARMRFTGHERDLGVLGSGGISAEAAAEDDLDYMHARYYKPLWGRFLSVDPAGGDPKSPQGWNRYSYVHGNPLKAVDPDGKNPVLVALAAAWAGAEIGLSLFDAYETGKIILDPSESGAHKMGAGGMFLAGLAGPGVYGPLVRRAGDLASAGRFGATLVRISGKLGRQFSHLDAAHAGAAGREAAGQVVKLRADGVPFDHLKEFNEARAGAINNIENLKALVDDPALSDAEAAFARYLLSSASKALDEAEQIFEQARRAAGGAK